MNFKLVRFGFAPVRSIEYNTLGARCFSCVFFPSTVYLCALLLGRAIDMGNVCAHDHDT